MTNEEKNIKFNITLNHDIAFDDETQKAEYDIKKRTVLITIFFCILGIILTILGLGSQHEVLIISGIIIFFFSFVGYCILAPIILILVGISRNLREINQQNKIR